MIKVLKVFYRFLLKKKGTFIFFLVLVVVASSLSAIQPYFYKLFVEAIPTGNYQNLIYILFAYVGVKVAELFFSVINFIVGDMIMIESSKDARASIFKHVQDLDFAFHSSKSTGSLISAFKRGDGAFYSFFHSIHHRILEIGVGVVVMVIFLSQLDWKAAKNKTTIIIAHRLSTVKRADKIVVMEKGRIAEVGSHKELLSKKGSLYSHFWGLQTRA